MKTTGRVLAAGALALLCGAGWSAQAATPPSPVGEWDCVVSGKQGVGLAHITFAEDFTFTGTEILTVNPAAPTPSSSSYDGRNPGGDLARGIYIGPGPGGPSSSSGSGSTGGTSSTGEQLFGKNEINGSWGYDIYNRVIGYFVQVVQKTQLSISTNLVQITWTVTNADGSISITNEIKPVIVTNSQPVYATNMVGVLAKVVPGERLDLSASTPNGKQVYRGKPFTAAPADLTGSWYVNKVANGQSLVEFFDAAPGATPYLFTIDGRGAGYTYTGLSMVSLWNKVAFIFQRADGSSPDGVLGVTYGNINPKKLIGKTKGLEEPSTRIRFDAYWYAPAPTAQ